MTILKPKYIAINSAIFAAISPLSTFSYANTTNINEASNIPVATLDPITVTATRSPSKVSEVIAQTTLIDEQDLQRYQGQTVLDILKKQPAISFYQSGGTGTISNFYMRGYDSKQILVLIDGIRYGSLSSGQAAINLLPTEQIERIEILHGSSGASIYGADAMGGVIQIFTKAGNDNQLSVTAGAGSNNHYLYGATATLSNDNTSMTLSATHNETDGINATLPTNIYSYYTDKDGYKSDNFSMALKQQLTDNLSAGISALYSESTTEFDNGIAFKNPHTDQKVGAAQAFIDWQYANNSSIKLQYGHSIDDSETFNAGYESYYNTDQDQFNLTGIHALPLGKAVYGTEYLNQSIDSSAYNSKVAKDRDVKSVFAGYQIAEDNYDAQANVRYDDNSQYGKETTYSLGAAFKPAENLRIGASYATGFRAPNYNELYSSWGGNPKLEPETSKNAEVFAEYSNKLTNTRLTAYHNRVNNIIAWQKNKPNDPNDWSGTMKNINKVNIEGVSINSDWNFDNYLFGLGYDYQKATDNKKDSTTYGNNLPIRPKHKGLVYAGYANEDFDIRAEYQYTDDYYSNVANADSQKVDGYGLVNFVGNYYLTPSLDLSLRINNLANKKYITLPDYNTDGTNVFGSLTYRF